MVIMKNNHQTQHKIMKMKSRSNVLEMFALDGKVAKALKKAGLAKRNAYATLLL